jgi:hypothetical protein
MATHLKDDHKFRSLWLLSYAFDKFRRSSACSQLLQNEMWVNNAPPDNKHPGRGTPIISSSKEIQGKANFKKDHGNFFLGR